MTEEAMRQSALCEALRNDDARLARAFESLLACFGREAEPGDTRAAWEVLDCELRARLRMEEELMLPIMEMYAEVETTSIRSEHQRIRQLLEQLEVDAELHQLNGPTTVAFLRLLREHAQHEQRVLHPWADETLLAHTKADVVWRLRVHGHGAMQEAQRFTLE